MGKGQQRPVIKGFMINKHRYYELQHMCLQYQEWKDMLRYLEPSVHSSQDGNGSHGNSTSSTENLAIKRKMISDKCELIENVAREVGIVNGPNGEIDISEYILKAVTNEGITYRYLDQVMNIPVGKNLFYERRRKFFYILAEKYK